MAGRTRKQQGVDIVGKPIYKNRMGLWVIRGCLSLLFCFWGSPLFADTDYALEGLFQRYISEVREAARAEYSGWLQTLEAPDPSGRLTGLHFHYPPQVRVKTPSLLRRIGAWFTGAHLPNPWLPSRFHLNQIRSISHQIRGEIGLQEQVGYRKYAWVEAKFIAFEKAVLSELGIVLSDFDEQMDESPEPSAYQITQLREYYLDAWVLAALLSVEGERYLDNYTIKDSLSEQMQERQEQELFLLAECRVALLMVSSDSQKW